MSGVRWWWVNLWEGLNAILCAGQLALGTMRCHCDCCSVCVFVVSFIYMRMDWMSPQLLFVASSSLAMAGYIIYSVLNSNQSVEDDEPDGKPSRTSEYKEMGQVLLQERLSDVLQITFNFELGVKRQLKRDSLANFMWFGCPVFSMGRRENDVRVPVVRLRPVSGSDDAHRHHLDRHHLRHDGSDASGEPAVSRLRPKCRNVSSEELLLFKRASCRKSLTL